MNTRPPINDERLLNATRGLASRHVEIPPVPRDTLAVLRQAAEQQREASAHPWLAPWWRWAAGVTVILALVATGWWLHPGAPELAQAPATDDVMESIASANDTDADFEAFWSEINETLVYLEDDEAWL